AGVPVGGECAPGSGSGLFFSSRRRYTRSKRDWSSDVCSSDLYELPNRKNTSLRNILWALGLTMAIVVVVGISFFGAGSITEQETPESSRVDVAASAERAEAAAGFSIAVPEPGDTWQERSARFDDGQEPRWQIDYTSPQGQLVVLVQGPQLSAAMLSSAVPGAVVEQEQQIDGVDCQVLSG